MADTSKEIEEMLSALGDPAPEKDEHEEEEEKEEKEETEEKEEKEEEKETKEDEETEEKEEETEEETDKDKIIENLRKRLEERSGPPQEKEEVKEKTDEEKAAEAERIKAEKEAREKAEALKFEDQDFIGDLDLDDLTRDKTALNKILNTVYTKGVNDSKRIATEGVLNTIPDIVKHNLTILTTLKEASDKFYKDNNDLAPFKKVVAAVFEEIASKNPDKKYSDLMDLVAPEARKRLELHKKAVKEDKAEEKEERAPRLHGVKSGQRQSQSHKPNTSALSKEIEEMNQAIRR